MCRAQRFRHVELYATHENLCRSLIGQAPRHLTPLSLPWLLSLRSFPCSRPHSIPGHTPPCGGERSPLAPSSSPCGRWVVRDGCDTAQWAYSGGEAGALVAPRRRAVGGASDGQKGRFPLLKPLSRSFFAAFVFDRWKIQIFAQKPITNSKAGLLIISTLHCPEIFLSDNFVILKIRRIFVVHSHMSKGGKSAIPQRAFFVPSCASIEFRPVWSVNAPTAFTQGGMQRGGKGAAV